MAEPFGVLRGKVISVTRENDFNTPHCQLKVADGDGQNWRVPINVLSADDSLLILHRVEAITADALLANLNQLPSRWTPRPAGQRSAANCLDFHRAPLFDIETTGLLAPHVGPQADDDLQDILARELERLRTQGGDVFVFGTEFSNGVGVHNIHMNQGNPPGRFQDDNGVFTDGGLILKFANRFAGFFLRFQSQWLPTTNQGHRSSGARLIPAVGRLGHAADPQPQPLPPHVAPTTGAYIERALVNPVGNDPGREVVVLGNTSPRSIDLTNWSIVDGNGRAEDLRGIELAPGRSEYVILTGEGAQFSNRGGTIALRDPSGVTVHAVSYSRAEAQVEGQFIRFIT